MTSIMGKDLMKEILPQIIKKKSLLIGVQQILCQ